MKKLKRLAHTSRRHARLQYKFEYVHQFHMALCDLRELSSIYLSIFTDEQEDELVIEQLLSNKMDGMFVWKNKYVYYTNVIQ